MVLLGIDLGTSSMKAMLLDEETVKTAVETEKYEVDIPRMNCAEQAPENWWKALKGILHRLKEKHGEEFARIGAVGLSGQMHGLVLTDKEGIPLRPAILWLDQRSGSQLQEIEETLGKREMGEIFLNRVFTGFAFPSLLWVKEKEKDIYGKIGYVMLPKDFLRMKMTGEIGTEASDASSTTIFHTAKREWAWDVIRRFGLPEDIFPRCREATDIAGFVTKKCAEETGLPEGIPVVYGAGDQPAQSIGNGCIREGSIIANIGTGGQISAYIGKPLYDRQLRTHTFCHGIQKGYTIMGATLCSGMSLNWLKNKILRVEDFASLSAMAGEVEPGSKGLIYLPYLSGERTPHMNPGAKGMFFGLTLSHDRRHMVRAVMEGVAFSLKDSLAIFEELGIGGDTVIASGGGASSGEWLQIQADIFGKEVKVCEVGEQACLGACILAGIGTGRFRDAEEACGRLVTFRDRIYEPDPGNKKRYMEQYEKYRQLYVRTAMLMD